MAAPRLVLPDAAATYKVVLGNSIRKSTDNKDDEGYETFKYEFMPASVDRACAGRMTREGKRVTVHLTRSSAEDDVVFAGKYEPEKKTECVLIYDSMKKQYVLERLRASNRNLRHVRDGDGRTKSQKNTPAAKRQRLRRTIADDASKTADS